MCMLCTTFLLTLLNTGTPLHWHWLSGGAIPFCTDIRNDITAPDDFLCSCSRRISTKHHTRCWAWFEVFVPTTYLCQCSGIVFRKRSTHSWALFTHSKYSTSSAVVWWAFHVPWSLFDGAVHVIRVILGSKMNDFVVSSMVVDISAMSVVDACCLLLIWAWGTTIRLLVLITLIHTMEIEDIKEKFGRFCILVIGRANAGRTTILKKICNSTENPEIYNGQGNKVRS